MAIITAPRRTLPQITLQTDGGQTIEGEAFSFRCRSRCLVNHILAEKGDTIRTYQAGHQESPRMTAERFVSGHFHHHACHKERYNQRRQCLL